MKIVIYAIALLLFYSCQENNLQLNHSENKNVSTSTQEDTLVKYYNANVNDSIESKSIGSVGNGKLQHGTLLPFKNDAFCYFDKYSYLQGRCFMHSKVAKIVSKGFEEMHAKHPDRTFYLMETCKKEGGKLEPHRTHQNGLSVDVMLPKLKNNMPFSDLDSIGTMHYFLKFNNQGELIEDTTIQIDFELVAQQILAFYNAAITEHVSIEKVIIKMEYKKLLFETPTGKLLKQKNIYFAKYLDPMVNEIHDDHFHIDFKL